MLSSSEDGTATHCCRSSSSLSRQCTTPPPLSPVRSASPRALRGRRGPEPRVRSRTSAHQVRLADHRLYLRVCRHALRVGVAGQARAVGCCKRRRSAAAAPRRSCPGSLAGRQAAAHHDDEVLEEVRRPAEHLLALRELLRPGALRSAARTASVCDAYKSLHRQRPNGSPAGRPWLSPKKPAPAAP
jgi:hypothetical protein